MPRVPTSGGGAAVAGRDLAVRDGHDPGTPAPLLALVGPTGVGKTAVAVALARHWPIEAVSVDSRQVYRRLDIGTGKPTLAERRALPHHLVDVVEPDDPYDAARFAREAAAAVEEIRRRGRWPVLVGGTGLYLRALLRGLAAGPPPDPALRRQLEAVAVAEGPEALHRRLAALDPASAARLHPRDAVRLVRALEVALLTGRPPSVVRADTWGRPVERYRVFMVGLTMPRPALDARLDCRVDRMLADGLLREVEELLAAGFPPHLPALQGIGYRHLGPVLTRGAPLGEAVRCMKRDTRRYARRQWTWFAREPVAAWVSVEGRDAEAVAAQVSQLVERARVFG